MSVRVRQVSSGKPNMMKQPKHEDKEQLRLLARQPQKHPLSKEKAASRPVLVEVLLRGSSRRRCIPLCSAHTLAMSQPRTRDSHPFIGMRILIFVTLGEHARPKESQRKVLSKSFHIQGTKRFNIEMLERRSICSWYSQPAIISWLNSPWELWDESLWACKGQRDLKLSDE